MKYLNAKNKLKGGTLVQNNIITSNLQTKQLNTNNLGLELVKLFQL